MGRLTDIFAGRSVTALTERARRRLAAGKLDEAARIVERGLEMYPGSNTLSDLHLSIRRARAHKTMRHLEVRIEARQDPIAYEELIKLYLSIELPEEAQRRAQAYVAWAAVHGLASLLIEGQILAAVDVDALIQQTTSTLLHGMRVREHGRD